MTAKMHRLHLPKIGEGVIHIPGGVPFEANDAPLPYPAGSYMRLGNKEFIYAIAGNTLNPDMGALNELRQIVAYNDIARSYDAGVTEIIVDVAGTDGNLGDGDIAADELVGGEIVFFMHSENCFTRGIVSNTAVDGGGEMTLVLDSPTPVAITENTHDMEIMANPYSSVTHSGGNDWAMVMGMPTVAAIVGQGLWLQVSGPSWVAPQDAVGAAAGVLEAIFRNDGSLEVRTADGVSDDKLNGQHAGVIICTSRAGGSQGAPFIMLQIAH